jgi:hypothetical protein
MMDRPPRSSGKVATMKRVVLIHFKPEQAAERLKELRRAGHDSEYVEAKSYRWLRGIRDNPPEAIVIDLTHLPSHGKAVGAALRGYAATRTVPLIFVGGDPKKTAGVRAALPDATFTSWEDVGQAIENSQPLLQPVRPTFDYSSTPLPKKLGINVGSRVMLIGAPETFEETLGPLPEGAEIVSSGRPDVLVVFTTTRAELELRFSRALNRADAKTRLWIAWPKKASGVPSDLSGNIVRDCGLGLGWVDYKVCAIDSTWSGFLFAPKKDAGARRLRQAATREESAAKKTNER